MQPIRTDFGRNFEKGRVQIQIRTKLKNFLKQPGPLSRRKSFSVAKFIIRGQPWCCVWRVASPLHCIYIYIATLTHIWICIFFLPINIYSIIFPPCQCAVCHNTRQFLFLSFLVLLDYKEFSQQQGCVFKLSPEDSNRFRTIMMQKAYLLLFNKILSIHRSYLCARFSISEIAWGDFRPDPAFRTYFGAKIGRVHRSGQMLEIFRKARCHPGKFLSRPFTIGRGPLVHVARDESKDAFYLVTRRFSNTINQLNPQPTQSTMSSSEGEEFNMDVSGSESNYESEPTVKKVGRLPF